MTNKDVINIINRLVCSSDQKVVYKADEVFTAIAHGYYYIKPGKNTSKFVKKIYNILNNGWKDMDKNLSETKNGAAYLVWLYGKMSADAMSVARSLFDQEYYESQCKNMVMFEKYDESLLERYM